MIALKSQSKNEIGFTAVELLVIMAIIFILMMIMLPVLQSMKMKTLDTVCMSNLRQFGLAGNMYWSDNDGRTFSFRSGQEEDGQVYWFGWMQSGSEGERRFDATKGALYPYIKDVDIRVCSRLDFINDRFKLKATGASYGYGYNLHLAGGVSGNPVLIESVKKPSSIVFLADAAQVNTFQTPASKDNPMLEEFYYVNDREKTAHFRHDAKGYAVFCDGSVSLQAYSSGSIDNRMPNQWVGRLPSAMLKVDLPTVVED